MSGFEWCRDEHGTWHGQRLPWWAITLRDTAGNWYAHISMGSIEVEVPGESADDAMVKADAWISSQDRYKKLSEERPILRKQLDVTLRRLRDLETKARLCIEAMRFVPDARRNTALVALEQALASRDLCPICDSVIDLQRALNIAGSKETYCGRECASRAAIRQRQARDAEGR